MTTSQHPIVLAHGLARFDVLVAAARGLLPSPAAVRRYNRAVGDALGYFRHIRRTLEGRGFEAHEPSVSFAGSLARRARDLKRAVEAILAPRAPGAKVHIIGHSMGGLDARYMIAKLGMADRVASLVTIGTPHWGSPVADLRVTHGWLHQTVLRPLRGLGLDLIGGEDLTTARCRAFNAEVEAAEAANGVAYVTVASAQEDARCVFPPLRGGWRILREREGSNDGLVSVASQRWTGVLRGAGGEKRVAQRDFPLPADHLNQLGWWHPWACPLRQRRPFEQGVRDLYVALAEELRARAPQCRS